MTGIAITTRNRPQVLDLCLKHFCMFYKGSQKIWVIDDNSDCHEQNKAIVKKYRDKGVMVNYHYNTERLGIAKSKNVGIEKLKDCEYYFLFDDDIFPVANNWWKPYIRSAKNTGNQHLQYIVHGALKGNLKKTDTKKGVDIFNYGSGCLLFFTNTSIGVVGGFNKNYGIYGMEHSGISIRTNNLGFTPYGIFLVPSDAKKYFHSLDMQGIVSGLENFESSMSIQERNEALLDQKSEQAYKEDLKKV